MTADEIRTAKYAEPFQPFTICIRDGRRWPVTDSFFVALSPTGETVGVGLPDGTIDFVAVNAIEKVFVGVVEFNDPVPGFGRNERE